MHGCRVAHAVSGAGPRLHSPRVPAAPTSTRYPIYRVFFSGYIPFFFFSYPGAEPASAHRQFPSFVSENNAFTFQRPVSFFASSGRLQVGMDIKHTTCDPESSLHGTPDTAFGAPDGDCSTSNKKYTGGAVYLGCFAAAGCCPAHLMYLKWCHAPPHRQFFCTNCDTNPNAISTQHPLQTWRPACHMMAILRCFSYTLGHTPSRGPPAM